MPIDPEIQKIIDGMASLAQDRPSERSVESARASQLPSSVGHGEDVARMSDRVIPVTWGSIPVRVYEPFGDGPFPILVFFHGGGWTTCSIDTHDALCRSLTNASGCVVVSVEYRLAPEYKFPAGFEDAFETTRYVAAHPHEFNGLDSVAVGCDSAGGNLAAAVALRARDEGGPELAFQLLAYPATDCRFDLPSYEENSEGYVMSTEEVRWLWEQYLTGPADAEHPYVSPLRAASHVGLPPALIITAEYDPVRDDGYAYAEKLRAAGVPVQHVNYEGMIHIHWMIPGHPSARLARMDAGEAVREALSTKP